MTTDAPFTLTRESTRSRTRLQIDNSERQRQGSLFPGAFADLPGQQDLFDAEESMPQSNSLPCLTVAQPWAWAIVAGHKRVENRTWRTRYRGPLLIHAGVSRKWLHAIPGLEAIGRERGFAVPAELTFGAIVGIVELVDCVEYSPNLLNGDLHGDPFASGPWCWIVERPQMFERPIPYSGALSLFQVPRTLLPG